MNLTTDILDVTADLDQINGILGGLLGLPGCAWPTDRELAEVAEWQITRMIALEREPMEVPS